MTKKKSLLLISIAAMLIFCITLAASYSYYQKTKKQSINNIVATSCLSLSLRGENEINLDNAVPISDEEGHALTPYTFTIENTCDMAVNYQVNLETLSNTTLQNTSIRVEIEDANKLYSEYSEGIKVIEGSKESKKLTEGTLLGSENKTYNLRLWLDKDTPLSEQGKIFSSKITVTGNTVTSYGVKRQIDSSSSEWERIEDSIGLEANAQIGTAEVKNDFDNIYPWSDIKSYNYDTGTNSITAWYGEDNFTFTPEGNVEVLTYIPEFYYTRYQTEGYEYILISKEYQENFSKSEAFSIGRYMMSGDTTRVHSRSGQAPLRNITITNARTYAQNLGTGFQQLDYHYFILQLLYLVEYADYNSQSKLGLGNSSNTVAIASGGCNQVGMKSGSIINDGKHSVIYRGIEDIFGNVYQFVDGINIQNNQAYINYNLATYQVDKFDGDYKKVGYVNAANNGYISKLGYDSENSLITLPIEINGSETTYMTDYYWQPSGNRIALVGGSYNCGLVAGLWYWSLSNASSFAQGNVGARLLKTS